MLREDKREDINRMFRLMSRAPDGLSKMALVVRSFILRFYYYLLLFVRYVLNQVFRISGLFDNIPTCARVFEFEFEF